MKRKNKSLLLIVFLFVFYACNNKNERIINDVNCMLGTGGDANLLPVASVPFGMVQLGPDMYLNNSGYKYSGNEIIGFSHTHMSGGGCNDYKDIMFFPQSDSGWINRQIFPSTIVEPFLHEKETAQPGYYSVELLNSNIQVELTATERSGMHRYTYPERKSQQLVINLAYGHNSGCTVCQEYNYDTVRISGIKVIDEKTISGYRISDGWLKGVTVNFYAEFSKPFKLVQLYSEKKLAENVDELKGTDLSVFIEFEDDGNQEVNARVGISPVDVEGAKQNLNSEIQTWNFDEVKGYSQNVWEKELSIIQIPENSSNRKLFYTMLYRTLFYPQLYSDVDGRFRGSDNKIHQGDFRYFAGTLSLWDTYRAQNPFVAIVRPDIANDLMKTFIGHYKNFGQLPQWVGAAVENWCMIGLPALPIIADCYYKGIRDYDVETLYEAMKVSANIDTFGFSEGNCVYKGNWLYKKYGYIPCEQDINSVAKSLEFNYSDWSLAQMAKMLGKDEDYDFYMNRSKGYINFFDSTTNLLRPKYADGSFRKPFDPVFTNHYHTGDDYCEGTAYQWTFSVPHDPVGLAELMGGKECFAEQLDSLFIRSPEIHDGGKGAPDLNPKGMIGQYAHANEPSHHIIYLYNTIGQSWKTQKWINTVRNDLYSNTPEGICGNEDCGQMTAWYIFSSMGFYPVTHGDGFYYIGTPMFKEFSLKHNQGVLTIKAENLSKENIYIQSLKINGELYDKNWLKHEDIFTSNTLLEFEMGNTPNKEWGNPYNGQ